MKFSTQQKIKAAVYKERRAIRNRMRHYCVLPEQIIAYMGKITV